MAVKGGGAAEARKRRKEIMASQRSEQENAAAGKEADAPVVAAASSEKKPPKKRKVDSAASKKAAAAAKKAAAAAADDSFSGDDENGKKTQIRYDPDVPMSKEQLAAWRREARRVRNRESAAASRQRIRNRISELEDEVHQWKTKYDHAMERLATLEKIIESGNKTGSV